jgi:uncharacterized protein (DUF433 family)
MKQKTPQFSEPLYTIAEAARIVDVPASTLATWAQGYIRRFAGRPDVIGNPIVTYIQPHRRGDPSIPFVGLAEAMVLAAVRQSGVPMQRIRPAIEALQRELGVDHALASRKLYTDGAELLFDYAASASDRDDRQLVGALVVVRSGQRVFVEVIDEYLRRIEYGPDGYARLIRVPAYATADVLAYPTMSFGAPVFASSGARVDDALQLFWAGEALETVAREFGVPIEQVEDVIRVASRRAA